MSLPIAFRLSDPDGDRPGYERHPKEVCAMCPVWQQCGDYALEHGIAYGVWGGMTRHERELVLGHQLHYGSKAA